MMTKHRIGRVDLPWENLEPPIRSPDYYINLEKRKKSPFDTSANHNDAAIKARRGKSIDLGNVRVPFSPPPCMAPAHDHTLPVTVGGSSRT